MVYQRSPNVWYFAYGSNMSPQKFVGDRGIQPLAAARVRLPGWVLIMDVGGLPYREPAFASIHPVPPEEKSKSRSVIGLAYLVTQSQYRSIIGSEGGGIAYSEVSVDAVPLTEKDETLTGPRLVVRTLGTALARSPVGRPSERYMNLVVEGAESGKLPAQYQQRLKAIAVYRPSKEIRRRLGAAIFLGFWGPIMALMEKITQLTLLHNGEAPLATIFLVRMTVIVMWTVHDYLHAPVWGRGDGLDDEEDVSRIRWPV